MTPLRKIYQRAAVVLAIFSLINAMVLPSYCLNRLAVTAAVAPASEMKASHRELSSGAGATFEMPLSTAVDAKLDEGARAHLRAAYANLPIRFESNRGQADRSVKFLAYGSGYSLELTPTEAVFELQGAKLGSKGGGKQVTHGPENQQSTIRNPQTAVLRMQLVGGNSAAQVEGLDQLPGVTNYFKGNDPAKWHPGVSTYAKVQYREIYPGVNLVFYGNQQQQLEYDFIVSPGADPDAIKLAFRGARSVRIGADGDLVLRTAGDEIRQHKPLIYQETDGRRQSVAGRFMMIGKNQVGFRVAGYDRGKPLVIDPTAVEYSTLFGGNRSDRSTDIAVDASGKIYVTGYNLSGNENDSFVVKIDPSKEGAASLVYTTLLSGNGFDVSNAIAVDAAGNAYVTGETGSNNFPVTPSAFQSRMFPRQSDMFLTKLNAGGNLLYSTYLGSEGWDVGRAIAVDSTKSDGIVLVGATLGDISRSLPNRTTLGADFAPVYGHVIRFDTTKSGPASLVSATRITGISIADMALDSSGNIYLTGSGTIGDNPFTTENEELPVVNGFQFSLADSSSPVSGPGDAFMAKLDATGTSLLYSTYFGGSNLERGTGIAVDSEGKAYITGYTASPNLLSFRGAPGFKSSISGDFDLFVAKIDPSTAGAPSLIYATFLGGSAVDKVADGSDGGGHNIAVDSSGNAYVTGFTTSPDFPTTADAIDKTCGADGTCDVFRSADAFVTKLNATGTALVFSTFLGGSGTFFVSGFDGGNSIAVDSTGNAYVTGITFAANFPVTPSAIQTNNQGEGDIFVVKLAGSGAPVTNTPTGTNVTVQSGDVAITFDNVTAAGNTTVTPIDPATLGGLPGQYQLLNGSQGFEITTTASFTGNIIVCINVVPPITDQATFDTLRILHGEGGVLMDRTILPPDFPAPNFGPQTICARVTSLSPFVLALLADSNHAPVARARNITVAADNSCSASIAPSDVDDGSFDPDSGDSITLSLDQSGPFSLGQHTVTLTATDNHGDSNSATATVTVVDNTPPSITGAAVDHPELGPPNHRMVAVTVSYGVTDNCGTPAVTLTVSSNEPENGTGDGNTAPDWEVVDAHHVRLRAERSGHGTGRIYTITITATDGHGNASIQAVTVRVPHN